MPFRTRSFDANTDFGLQVLYVISTEPTLAALQATLILKGGAALLHGYASGRATRKDLDFGLWSDIEITQDIIDDLFLSLEGWGAAIARGRHIEHSPAGTNIPMQFRHPGTRSNGRLEMQISRRRGSVPPRLNDSIKPITLRTYSGIAFDFPAMPLEEIVAEKVIRTFNKVRTDTPREEDLYDLGFIEENHNIDHGLVDWVFAQLRRAEGSNCSFKADRVDAVAAAMKENGAVDLGLYEKSVSLEKIRERILAGAGVAKRVARAS